PSVARCVFVRARRAKYLSIRENSESMTKGLCQLGYGRRRIGHPGMAFPPIAVAGLAPELKGMLPGIGATIGQT
ncbi:hypothetical protein ACLFKT_31510, partial [Paraburkholderia sp. BR14261]